MAYPENHTVEPKIMTLSYIQPELGQFKDFTIETMVIFSNFPQNSVKYKISLLYDHQKDLKDCPCAEPRRLTY